MISHLLIPTAGRPTLFARVIESLRECVLPPSLSSIVIVENGAQAGAEAICERARDRLPIRYRWSPRPCKSVALNVGLEGLEDDALIMMSDDDVRFEPQTLVAYEREAIEQPRGWFFGGPFEADFESVPPEWLLRYLPPSARGWLPRATDFDSSKDRFFGCNWAVFARDLRAEGGFDLRFGPGTMKNATGEEFVMQRRLHERGMRSRLIEDARVWHYVPTDRCSPSWAIARSHRNGLARGLTHRTRHAGRVAANHTLNAFRYTAGAAMAATAAALGGPRLRFQAEYHRRKAAGYFEGYFAQDPESLRAAWIAFSALTGTTRCRSRRTDFRRLPAG